MSTGAWRETLITVCCRLFNKAKTQCLYCRCWEGNIDYSVLQNVKQAKNTVSTGAGREILITVCCRMLSKAKTQCLQVPGEGKYFKCVRPSRIFCPFFRIMRRKKKNSSHNMDRKYQDLQDFDKIGIYYATRIRFCGIIPDSSGVQLLRTGRGHRVIR